MPCFNNFRREFIPVFGCQNWTPYLLTERLTQTIALVKDEVTAAIMSCFPTPYVWVATGKDDITEADLSSLEERSLVVFPNKGDYQRWQDNLRTTKNLRFHISDLMEKAQGNVSTIAQMMLSQQTLRPTEEEAALMRLTAAHPSLACLVDVLGLEVVSVTKHDASSVPMAATKANTTTGSPVSSKAEDKTQAVKSEQETRWHGRNPECHQCCFSHEGINGTYCDKLGRYVEHGKGDCETVDKGCVSEESASPMGITE